MKLFQKLNVGCSRHVLLQRWYLQQMDRYLEVLRKNTEGETWGLGWWDTRWYVSVMLPRSKDEAECGPRMRLREWL